MTDAPTTSPATIVVYGTTWCGDCRRSKRFLDRRGVPYEWVNIEERPDAVRFVERLNGGYRTVPTIVFPDGRVLVEPSDRELASALGLEP